VAGGVDCRAVRAAEQRLLLDADYADTAIRLASDVEAMLAARSVRLLG
jgi:hypothetical protein